MRLGAKLALSLVGLLAGLAITEGTLRWLDLGDPPIFQAHPHYGYLMAPGQSVSTRGYRFQINHAGLRGPDFAVPKPKEIFRIVFLGESITYGGGQIRDQDLFPNRVAVSLGASERRPMEAINLAAPGWGIQNMAAYVTAHGLFDADLLIWVVSAADFRRPKTTLLDHDFSTHKPFTRTTYVASILLGDLVDQLTARPSPADMDALEQNVASLQHTLADLTRRGMPCAAVIVPVLPPSKNFAEDLARFRSTIQSLSVPLLDASFLLRRPDADSLFTDGVHLSASGHTVLAEALTRFFREQLSPGALPLRRAHPAAHAPRTNPAGAVSTHRSSP